MVKSKVSWKEKVKKEINMRKLLSKLFSFFEVELVDTLNTFFCCEFCAESLSFNLKFVGRVKVCCTTAFCSTTKQFFTDCKIFSGNKTQVRFVIDMICTVLL